MGGGWESDRRLTDHWRTGADCARGEPEPLTLPDPASGERAHGWPVALPGGTAVLFTVSRVDRAARLAVLSLDDGEWRHLFPATGQAAFFGDDRLVYQLDAELLSVVFDLDALETRGAPQTVLTDLAGSQAPYDGLGRSAFSLSTTGTLLYRPGRDDGAENRLVWVDRRGVAVPLSAHRARHGHPRLSPDGRRVAVVVGEGVMGGNVWVQDVESGERTRLTSGGGDNRSAVWSPDGRTVAFASNRTGGQNIFLRLADGGGESVRLLMDGDAQNPTGWSAAARLLTFYTIGAVRDRDIWTSTPEGEARAIVASSHDERSPLLPPDGRLLVYVSDESGRDAVHVRLFPQVDRPLLASYDGATEPVWSRDGRELFFWLDHRFMVASVDAAESEVPRLSEPSRLFERLLMRDAGGHVPNYDVSTDGRRFVMIERADPRTSFRLVLNFRHE